MAVQLRHERLVGLVDAAARHEQRAVRELVEICGADIAQYCRRRGAADSEALTNLVFAEFFAALPRLTFDADQQVWAFLYRIARNRLVDEFRRQTLEPLPEMLAGVHPLSQPDPADRIVDQDWLRGLVSNLSEDQQRVIELRFGEDLSLAETAKRTGKSIGAVKALQHRAVAALATLVALAGLLLAIGLSQPTNEERIISVPADGSSVTGDPNADQTETPPVTTRRQAGVPETTAAPPPANIPEASVSPPTVDLHRPSGTTDTGNAVDAGTEIAVLDQPLPQPEPTATSLDPQPAPEATTETTLLAPSATGTPGAPGAPGNPGSAATTVPADPTDGEETASTVTPVPSGGPQDVEDGPMTTPPAAAPAPAPTETTVGESVMSPLVVVDDVFEYFAAGEGIVIGLRVLANDQGVDVDTVSIVSRPDAGSLFLIPAGTLGNPDPLLQYVPGDKPRSTAMVYQACNSAGDCQTASVSLIYKAPG